MTRVLQLSAAAILAAAALVTGASGDSPLTAAVKARDVAAVRVLIKSGADVNVRAGDGSTPLLWAAHNASAEIARALIRAIAEGVIGFEVVPPHRVHFANPEGERLLGVQETQAIGLPLADLIELRPEPDSCCRSIDDWTHCPAGGEFEATLRTAAHPGGFSAALTFAPVVEDGASLAVLTLRDIRQRRLTEEKLRLSDKVFEFSAEAIVITDAVGRILADAAKKSVEVARKGK